MVATMKTQVLALAAMVMMVTVPGYAHAQASLDDIDMAATSHDRPFLVMDKAFPPKVGVERSFPVVITLYNVGENSAFDVSVEDLTWYSGMNEGTMIDDGSVFLCAVRCGYALASTPFFSRFIETDIRRRYDSVWCLSSQTNSR